MVSEYPFCPTIEKVFWKDVQPRVAKIAPTFAKLVNAVNPGKDFPLYKACYPYGSLIVKDGICYYPTVSGALVPFGDSQLTMDLRHNLSYSRGTFPFGMVLNKSIELFIAVNNRAYIESIFAPGHLFALWRRLEDKPTFHPNKLFNITAGARSIFLLPNIGDAYYHKNLRREFGIKIAPPKDLLSQWELFKTIANHPAAKCSWHTELLYFSGKWLEKIHSNDKNWVFLSRYLFQLCWQHSTFMRNKIFYDFIFSQIQATRNLRPNPYIADIAKHLLIIALGELPGFAPALDNLAAPIDILQKTFLDIYRLQPYTPTLMQPHWFSLYRPERPIYYSLTLPTSLEFSPNCRKVRTTLYDLRELAHILQIYLDEIPKDYLKINNTLLTMVARNIKFDYYHDKFDRENYAKHTSEMPQLDPTLMSCPAGYPNNTFPQTASFLRGCVKISLKK